MDIILHYTQHPPLGSDAWMHHGILMKSQIRRLRRKLFKPGHADQHAAKKGVFFMKQDASIVRNVLFYLHHITSLYYIFAPTA